jgi:hypothetical protein
MTYRITPITRAQRVALFKIFQRDFPSWTSPGRRHARECCPECGYGGAVVRVPTKQWRAFRRRAFRAFGDCVMINWAGMILGIETDGYTHS